jgi:uncharacterized protein HemX
MSGITTATVIALGSLGLAAVGTGVSIYQGKKSGDAQQQALKNQNTATQKAEADALSTERKNETATNAANMKTPDISSILTNAANASKVGVGSTMLTGPNGVAPGALSLGKSTLLGS